VSKRMINCLSAVSALALSWAWAGAAQAGSERGPVTVVSGIADTEEARTSRLAADVLVSAALKGYDLYSATDLQVALREALLPMTAERARQVPAMMSSVRLLGLGPDASAAAMAVMAEALAGAPTDALSPVERVQLAQSLQTAGRVEANTQLAQVELDVELDAPGIDCGNGTFATSAFVCTILQKQEDDPNLVGRGVGNYGG
jgi:hypothetical protein